MSVTGYEDWILDDEDWEYVPVQTMTEDLLRNAEEARARQIAEQRPIVDLLPIDEFGTKPMPKSMVDDRIERNKKRRSELKLENNNLRSYPLTDEQYIDGTVLIWHTDSEWGDRHFAAVREDGRWYVVGQMHGFHWDELVVRHLKDFNYAEIEVVYPAGTE